MTYTAISAQNTMSDPDALPSTRHLLTSLINTLATSTQQHDARGQHHEQTSISNPLLNASQTAKSTLLTLHTLFPTDLLPALDLLDRGLVTRFVLASPPSQHQDDHGRTQPQGEEKEQDSEHPASIRKQTLAYYVRSSRSSHPSRSHQSSRSSASAQSTAAITTHEIHLKAWNCSCPAFAFAAFPADLHGGLNERAGTTDDNGNDQAYEDDGEGDEEWFNSPTGTGWRFGGLTRGNARAVPPVCKHLLACVIAERCGSFAGLVEEREMGVEEVAGWAAGWGD